MEQKKNKQADTDDINPSHTPLQCCGLRRQGMRTETTGADRKSAGPPRGVIRHWAAAKNCPPMLDNGITSQRNPETKHHNSIDHCPEMPLLTGNQLRTRCGLADKAQRNPGSGGKAGGKIGECTQINEGERRH